MGGTGGDGSAPLPSPVLHYRTLAAVKFISFSVVFAAVFELVGAFSGAVVFWATGKDAQECSVALRIWILILTIYYAVSLCLHAAMFRRLLGALGEDSPSNRRAACVGVEAFQPPAGELAHDSSLPLPLAFSSHALCAGVSSLLSAVKSTLWRVNYGGALARGIWTLAAAIFLASASACSTVVHAASPGAITTTAVFICWHVVQRATACAAFYLVFLRHARRGVTRHQLKSDALHYIFL